MIMPMYGFAAHTNEAIFSRLPFDKERLNLVQYCLEKSGEKDDN